jgi:hypothetical protein
MRGEAKTASFRSFSIGAAPTKILLDFCQRDVYNGIYLDLGVVRGFLRRRDFLVLIKRLGSF